jgi:hypothetical protein
LIALDGYLAGDFDAFVTTGFTLNGPLGNADQTKQAMAVEGLYRKKFAPALNASVSAVRSSSPVMMTVSCD